MKNYIKITLLFLICTKAISQDTNNLSIISAPGTYIDFGQDNYTDDGFNIGISNTWHWNNWVYVGAELFIFPDLNTFDYTHLAIKLGVNHFVNNKLDEPILKLHTGGRAGFISRESVSRLSHLLGLELGLTFYIPNTKLFLLVNFAHDIKTDNKPLNGTDKHDVNSLFGGVGIRF